jgi:hypothetical protein
VSDWIKVKVDHVDHPKIDALTDAAYRWMHRAWAYAGKHETDGHLPPSWVKRVPPRVRKELDEAHLWHENGTPSGRELNDWLDHQPSRTELQNVREANRERAKKWRSRNAVTNNARIP